MRTGSQAPAGRAADHDSRERSVRTNTTAAPFERVYEVAPLICTEKRGAILSCLLRESLRLGPEWPIGRERAPSLGVGKSSLVDETGPIPFLLGMTQPIHPFGGAGGYERE